jgi:hypothetical protein
MSTAVFAKVTHIGEDYATLELTVQTSDSNHPELSFPKIEVEVPKSVGDFLEKHGAYDEE